MIRRVLPLLALLLLAPLPARADALGDAVRTIPAEIDEVRIAGEWQQEGKAGVYRILVARSGTTEIRARFFIQWVAYLESGPVIAASEEIAEVAELGADVRETTVEMAGDRLVVSFELAGKGDVEGTYEAIVRGPGEYRFQKAGN